MKKVKFGSKIGLIAATVGSAVGLGNVWRFPAEAQANGGAAFLLLYVACLVLLGLPVMLSEFVLGRGTGCDTVGAFKKLAPGTRWWFTGMIALVASYLILSYYMVVAGWTVEYLWQSVTGVLYDPVTGSDGMEQSFAERMGEYTQGSWLPLIATLVMVGINIVVLIRGVNKGIEKMANVMTPVLFVILLVLACVAMTLPGATDGLVFFFKPRFDLITPQVAVSALGQAFYSLSLGMGILITYSSYFPRNTHLTRTAVTISTLDLLVAVLTGMVIFPAVTSFGLQDANLGGATLVFVTLPEVFAQMPFTRVWSSAFFLLLFVAALTSTISLAEVTVAFLEQRFQLTRKRAVLTAGLPLAVLAAICCLSQGPWERFHVLGMNIFSLFDTIATNYMLPIAAFFTCLFVGWKTSKKYLPRELGHSLTRREHLEPSPGSVKLAKVLRPVLRWVAPILIAIILLSQIW